MVRTKRGSVLVKFGQVFDLAPKSSYLIHPSGIDAEPIEELVDGFFCTLLLAHQFGTSKLSFRIPLAVRHISSPLIERYRQCDHAGGNAASFLAISALSR